MNPNDTAFQAMVCGYAELETRVRQTMADLCGAACATCTSRCCTPDICEEALSSAFLSLLRDRYCPAAVFTDQFGWQGGNGCDLTVGRPPICYAFFCREILDDCALPRERDLLTALGRLMEEVGRNALGEQSLVDIRTPDNLRRVATERILQQLARARDALAVIRASMETGNYESSSMI
jgi:hypothetical protein